MDLKQMISHYETTMIYRASILRQYPIFCYVFNNFPLTLEWVMCSNGRNFGFADDWKNNHHHNQLFACNRNLKLCHFVQSISEWIRHWIDKLSQRYTDGKKPANICETSKSVSMYVNLHKLNWKHHFSLIFCLFACRFSFALIFVGFAITNGIFYLKIKY